MNSELRYCQDYFAYSRRITRELKIGPLGIGNRNPIRLQSIILCDPLDTEECVNQAINLTDEGCEIVRIVVRSKKEAANLANITQEIKKSGYITPLVADIRGDVEVALEAIQWVPKIRVNPCNFRAKEEFVQVVKLCKSLGCAMRIGSNRGALCACDPSASTQSVGDDCPEAMVQRALNLAEVAREFDYHAFCFSMKASEPKFMVEAYRLLVARLNQNGPDWNYPVHLGVTKARDAEDGRIKSSIGIGSLLADGIGDTIRVTLCNNTEHEIPVALAIIDDIQNSYLYSAGTGAQRGQLMYDPFTYTRRPSQEIDVNGCKVGSDNPIRIFTNRIKWNKLSRKMDQLGELTPEAVIEDSRVIAVDPYDTDTILMINAMEQPQLITVVDGIRGAAVIHAFRLLANKLSARHPILLKDTLRPLNKRPRSPLTAQVKACRNIGSLLCDGIGDAILIQGESNPEKSLQLAFHILQATGHRD